MQQHSKLYADDDPSLGELINRTARLLRRLADQRLAPLGLSSGYLPVLSALRNGDALSQRVLTKRAGIEQPTMAATLTRMERDQVVERQPDPDDKRSARFSLTQAASEKLGAIGSVIGRMNEDALGSFAEPDRQSLRRLLQRVAANLELALADRI